MVVIPSRQGQLGNQLFHIAHFAAAGREHGYRSWYASFEQPIGLFPKLAADSWIRVSQASVLRNLWQHRIGKTLRLLVGSSPWHQTYCQSEPPNINIGSETFVREAQQKLVLCEGFGFRDPQSVINRHAELKELFRFSDEIRNAVDEYETGLLPSGKSLRVGFHIRRGDYREFEDGRFYLEDDQWISIIQQVRDLARARGERFQGILFSNEGVQRILGNEPDLKMGPGGIYTDLEMLSRCDLIVAPRSTYSGWASFINKVPLLTVERSVTEVELSAAEVLSW